jgi:DNA-binding NarL/FixJ family response regulator
VSWSRKLLIVEDEPLMATLLSQALEREGFAVRSCGSAAEARAIVDDFDPDGALIDIHLGLGPSGVHLGHILHQTHPHVGLVFLTKYPDPEAAGGGQSGFPPGSAFVSKDDVTDAQHLVTVIEAVLMNRLDELDPAPDGPLRALTRVQLEILRLAALGFTNAAIARQRSTNERTVEQRLQSVYQALGIPTNGDVNPRVEAVRQYIMAAGVPGEQPVK